MPIVSGYTIHLYCENEEMHRYGHSYDDFNNEYFAEGRNCYTKARVLAKRDGWILKRDGRAFCPDCSKKTKTP